MKDASLFVTVFGVVGADTNRAKLVLTIETRLLENNQALYFRTNDARVAALVAHENVRANAVGNGTTSSQELQKERILSV